MQQDFERRGDRGRGDFGPSGDDRDYERIYDNYGEGSQEFDRQQRRPDRYGASDRGRQPDRGQYGDRQRQDRFADEMRGSSGDRDRFGRGRGDDAELRNRTRSSSPYDRGEIGSWYGGDSGMGDSGSSLDDSQYDDARFDLGQQGSRQPDRGRFQQRQSAWDRPSQRQASSQYGQAGFGQRQFGQQQFRERFSGERFDDRQGGHDPFDGPFTGRGPRNYHRSDERIYDDVCDLLPRHGEIDATSMEVEVHNGVVTLHGTADSGRIRRLTEEVVEGVAGVHDVRNDLRVNQRTGYAETEATETRRPGAGRSDAGRQDTGRFEAGRQEAGRHELERTETGRTETGAFAMRSGGTSTGQTQQTQTGGQTNMGGQPQMGGQAQAGGRFSIREAMDVVGSDGVMIGRVKETRGNEFLVDRSMQRDVYVPMSAIHTVDGDRVMLNVSARDVDQQGWNSPDLASTGQQSRTGNV